MVSLRVRSLLLRARRWSGILRFQSPPLVGLRYPLTVLCV